MQHGMIVRMEMRDITFRNDNSSQGGLETDTLVVATMISLSKPIEHRIEHLKSFELIQMFWHENGA